ncbi:MAG: hypothetical protein AVO33_06680 [delta proteobacterium ML8_F1]|nr:MAG: hypothetical protein AVO33_06680 [delta proteobacterium ML8_F1]
MRLAFISPYQELSELVEQVSSELGISIDVFQGAFDEGAEIARRLEGMDYDIIISRGATSSNISEVVGIPVVNCGIASIDIMNAVYEATKLSRRIGLILSNHSPNLSKLIQEIFDIEFLYRTEYKSMNDVEQLVKEAILAGAEVIVGGVATKRLAEENGVRSILLRTSYESVKQSIMNAVEIINVSQRQMFQAARFNNILNFSHEGIIGTDAEGNVTVFNPAAEKIFGISAVEIIGKRADKYIPTTGLLRVIESGKEEIGEIQRLERATIVTSRIPIRVRGELKGVVATFEDITKIQDYELKIRSELHKKGLVAKYTFSDYVGQNPSGMKMLEKARIFARSDSTVLITGESGTGKEILAQAIHNDSNRKKLPFVAVNCSAIPENLLESELFGYAEGAFSGAKKGGKMGMFELAHLGTIFLDEIGSIPLNLQSRLLRVLQEREVWRVGSNHVVTIDVRVIAATNEDLYDRVIEGRFRKDLYYRLNVLRLNTIPLRFRKDDIPLFLKFFYRLIKKESWRCQKPLLRSWLTMSGPATSGN